MPFLANPNRTLLEMFEDEKRKINLNKPEEDEEMKRVGDVYRGDYLKASDILGKRLAVVVDHVEIEEIGQEKKEQKLVVYMVGKDRGLVLNKTNAMVLTEIAGTDDADQWHGVKFLLTTAKVRYGGKVVDGLSVEWLPGLHQAPPPVTELGDDDVPF